MAGIEIMLVRRCGWHRDHAREALWLAAAGPQPLREPRAPIFRVRAGGHEALRVCGATLNRPV